ncbi:hypothetical protein SAY86_017811 [Trapa natans]|uniref:DEAD/DEAH box helicase domain-containing protein n=1 Tax=Trapa natans TaxID=22666 RepID=A0AAN7M237_TRANT|nr:hypothetical protein SAY86_017811 [Trapa natans]
MAKGDDSIARKRNKANRKKLGRQGSSNVSARVASIIAAKKRRKSGKRLKCQGMCFSLPTPDDPFNDRLGKNEVLVKVDKKRAPSHLNGKSKSSDLGKGISKKSNLKADNLENSAYGHAKEQVKETRQISNVVENHHVMKQKHESGCPSKFLILCLKTIQDSLGQADSENVEMVSPFFANAWGLEFWKTYATGTNILEITPSCSSAERIAWIASVAADSIVGREKEGFSFSGPFLLYLVPEREKACEVRNICKPLKALGIHTVSIHAGADLDLQIRGLKSCDPEFLISTPDRLLELILLKAIDISGISLLVVDESLTEGISHDTITAIKSYICGDHRSIVFHNKRSCMDIY